MKKHHLYILLSFLIFSCNQKKELFTLNATLTNIPDNTLFYLKDLANITLDSAYVINGKLSVKAKLKSSTPERLTLFAISPEFIYVPLYVSNEQVTFKADKTDFPWKIDMSGSEYQDQAERFNQVEYQRQLLKAKLKNKYGSDKELLYEKTEKMSDSLDNESVKLIKENFNSHIALRKVQYYRPKFSTKELSNLYNQLDDKLKETIEGKAVKLQSEYPNPKVGDTYYDSRAVNQNRDTLSLSDIKNKYILLHFSSYNCYGSQLSLPELKELHNNYVDDLEIISISTDIKRESWEKHVKRDSIPWNYLWDGKGNYNDIYVKYWGIATPTYVLISPDKIIREKWYGYGKGIIKEKLGKFLEK